ncbi:MAG: hypothetical protein FWD28_10520 [Treponema sp.]|nr:hypothetical protein [Treponema sp.]
MIGFLIRKTIYDLWDNLFKVAVLNLGFFISLAVPIFLPTLVIELTGIILLGYVILAAGVLFCFVYLAAAAFTIKVISDHGNFIFADFLGNFKKALVPGIIMGLFAFFAIAIFVFVIPFYSSMDSPIVGLMLASIVFWTLLFAILSFQFYFSVIIRLGPNLFKSIKKCMLIALDNTGLAIFLVFNNFIAIAFSIFFAFMFPGPVGALLYIDQALRLRLLKYDWLEANPGANRRKIPWDELLIEEREKTGTRTLKNFIFPWKD